MLLNCKNVNKKNPQGKRKPSRPKITWRRELQDEIPLVLPNPNKKEFDNIMKACILHVVSLVIIVQDKQTLSRAAMLCH